MDTMESLLSLARACDPSGVMATADAPGTEMGVPAVSLVRSTGMRALASLAATRASVPSRVMATLRGVAGIASGVPAVRLARSTGVRVSSPTLVTTALEPSADTARPHGWVPTSMPAPRAPVSASIGLSVPVCQFVAQARWQVAEVAARATPAPSVGVPTSPTAASAATDAVETKRLNTVVCKSPLLFPGAPHRRLPESCTSRSAPMRCGDQLSSSS